MLNGEGSEGLLVTAVQTTTNSVKKMHHVLMQRDKSTEDHRILKSDFLGEEFLPLDMHIESCN